MKRLILMRHAKSSWADPGQADLDRPLNERGRRNAAAIGGWLRARNYVPDQALISTAARTRETWAGVAPSPGACPAHFLPGLYHADPAQMLAALREATGATVLMLGHQPGIGALAARLVRTPPNDPEFERFPTAATAILDFAIADWSAAGWNGADLTDFTVPRALSE